jgi:hypothetical protein
MDFVTGEGVRRRRRRVPKGGATLGGLTLGGKKKRKTTRKAGDIDFMKMLDRSLSHIKNMGKGDGDGDGDGDGFGGLTRRKRKAKPKMVLRLKKKPILRLRGRGEGDGDGDGDGGRWLHPTNPNRKPNKWVSFINKNKKFYNPKKETWGEFIHALSQEYHAQGH